MSQLTRRSILTAALIGLPSLHLARAAEVRKIIVPLPVGTGADSIIRVVAHALGEMTGETFVVENRPGAGGTTGTAEAARAKPDGNTLLLALSSTFVGAPHLFNKVPYDVSTDFAPVGLIGTISFVLVVHRELPVSDFRSFVAYAKHAVPPTLYGRGNIIGKILAEQLKRETGIEATEVPYLGEPAVLNDMQGRQIDWAFVSTTPALGLVAQGDLKALAVATPRRSLMIPDAPTMREAGLKSYLPLGSWAGLAAPIGTPTAIIAKLNSALNVVLGMAQVQQALKHIDVSAQVSTPEEFGTFIRSEAAKWSTVVPPLNIPKT